MRPALTALAASLALAFAAHAQQVPNAGDVMRDTSKPQLQLPKAEPALPQAQPVRPALKKDSGFKMVVNGFRITGNSAIKETDLQILLTDNLGKEAGFNDLLLAADNISNYYRSKGYFVARAYLPQQEIKDGIVEIAVLEGRVGKDVVVQSGSKNTKPAVLQAFLDANVPPGAVVQEKALERAALLANDLPGIAANISLDPGANTGETDVTLNANEGRLITGSLDADNFGNYYTGQIRGGVTLNVNSPFGLGDQIIVRAMQSQKDLSFGRVAYQLPVGGSGLKLGAAYSKVDFTVCCQAAGFNPSGSCAIASLYGLYPMVRSRDFNAYFNISYDNKASINNSGVTTSTERNINLLTLGTSIDARDQIGGGGLNFFNASFGAGTLNIRNATDATTDATTAQAAGSFAKLGLQASRVQRLSERFSLYGGVNGQLASKNLDSAEKFSLGGAQGVRAYPSGEATGDQGYVGQIELRADLPIEAYQLSYQAFLFTDYGYITVNRNNYVAGGINANNYSLRAMGIGINIAKAGSFQIRSFVATKRGNNPAASVLTGADVDGSSSRTRFWLQAVSQF